MATLKRDSLIQDEELFDGAIHPEDSCTVMDEQHLYMRSKPQISEQGEYRRERYRSSREFDTPDKDDDDDVFDDSLKSSVMPQCVRRCKSDSALPDLVLSSGNPSCNNNSFGDDSITNFSPDIIQDQPLPGATNVKRKSILITKDICTDVKEQQDVPTRRNKQPFKRSVSFQDRGYQSPKENAQQKRDSYRKSSGYITGGSSESKASSMQSQMSENYDEVDSTASQVHKTLGNVLDNQDVLNMDSTARNTTLTNSNPLPIFSDIIPSFSYVGEKNSVSLAISYESGQKSRDFDKHGNDKSITHTYSDCSLSEQQSDPQQLPRFNVLCSVSNVEEGQIQNTNNNTENTSEIHNPETATGGADSDQVLSGILPNFDELLNNDSSVELPAEMPEVNSSPVSATNPASLYQTYVPGTSYVLANYVNNKNTPEAQRTSPPFQHYLSDDFVKKATSNQSVSPKAFVSKREMGSVSFSTLQDFYLRNVHLFDSSLELFPNRMTSDSSVSPSPHNLHPDHRNIPQAMNAENQIQQTQITRDFVEQRCLDYSCPNDKCNLVSRALIGLQHVLDGYRQFLSSQEVQDLCYSLYEHAQNCTQPKFRCHIPWCYYLAEYIEEMPPISVNLICYWIKVKVNRPIMREDIFPSSPPQQFIKIMARHHHDMTTSLDVLCPMGEFGNVFLVYEAEPALESYGSVRDQSDRNYIVKRIYNDCESDFNQLEVYRRIINRSHNNLLAHFWIAEYPEFLHICTAFVAGGSLRELLQTQVLLCPLIVAQLMDQIMEAVHFLHGCGIIYLYWTCDNILLDKERQCIVVSNLSLSVTQEGSIDEGFTKQSLPPYIVPPELITGSRLLCVNSDSWGAGCIMMEMLTGKRVWYRDRHDSKELLWKKVVDGNHSPLDEERRTIRIQNVINLLQRCFKVRLSQRIAFEDLMTEIKKMHK